MGELQRLRRRIARIKLVPFLDALERIAPDVEVPARLPAVISCLLPDHEDRHPSCSLKEDRWWCYSCGRGGDAIDLVQHSHEVGLKRAVAITEAALGIGDHGDDEELVSLLAVVRAERKDPRWQEARRWRERVAEVEAEFFAGVRPYLRCADPTVQDLAWSTANHVFRHLDRADSEPPDTERGRVEELRRLRRWTRGWARDVARSVLRSVGKDGLDVALQGPLGGQ